MSDQGGATADVTSAVRGVEQAIDYFVGGLDARRAALGHVGAEFDHLCAALEAAGTSPLQLGVQVVAVVALSGGTFLALRRLIEPVAALRGWRGVVGLALMAFVALVVGFVAARFLAGGGLPMRTLRLWTIVTVAACLVFVSLRAVLTAAQRPGLYGHLCSLAYAMSLAIGWAIAGLGLVSTLQLWGSEDGLKDLVGTGFVVLPGLALFCGVLWHQRRTLVVAVAGARPRSRWRARLARIWPAVAIAFLVITVICAQIALTLGITLPAGAVLATVLFVLAAPHLDAVIERWAEHGLASPDLSIAAAAGRQTARFGLIVVLAAMLSAIWAAPLAALFRMDLRHVALGALEVALIGLMAAFLWNLVGTVTGRALRAETAANAGADEATPRSRLGTLVPLMSGIGKSSILALALLSILVSIGVNVWPLITGLSVFGLAIGFGSQTLVRDVVSGLFFLIDDAFRFGEYIETSGAKGTVEKISIRSVSLRHQRGAVTTIPYGQIGKIQNLSRDWVVEKLQFRVAFDTDVEKVRKIFKKIGQEIADNPELAPDLLEPFKSQGIEEVEDGTLLITAKFKAKAGKQLMIRRAALTAVQRAFRENGIRAVAKPVMVHPEAPQPAG